MLFINVSRVNYLNLFKDREFYFMLDANCISLKRMSRLSSCNQWDA